MEPEPEPEPRAPLSKEARAARRARAQKEWARTARAQLSEPQLAATKAAMRALKAGEIETPDFCAAALAVFREVEDEVARARLVRAMEQLLPPKFRALYYRLAAGAVDVAAAAAAEAPGGQAAEIEPGLLLGGWDAVQSAEALRARGVTHILTVGAADMLAPEVADDSSGFVRKLVEANDMPETDLLAHFDACVEFISEGLGGGRVLVHCWAGHSRSVTVLCAYLLRHPRGPEIEAGPGEAVDAVLQRIRSSGQPLACPNDGFMEQLRWFAAMRRGTRRERASAELAYRVFRMECIRREYGTLMLEMLPPELTAAADCADVEAIYRCRGCRQVIFTSDNVLPHSSGVGQAAFSWHRRDRSSDVAETTCNTLHLEPMAWMGIIGNCEVQGKLRCSCGHKLGSYHWAGMQCSCGAWVTPAFAVGKARVDVTTNRTLAVGTDPQVAGDSPEPEPEPAPAPAAVPAPEPEQQPQPPRMG